MVVDLAFTQRAIPPDRDDQSYTAWADHAYDERANELDELSGFGPPEQFPDTRQRDYNTVHLSTEGRPHIVDNDTLNGEPAPNAELARELQDQTRDERYARFSLFVHSDDKLRRLCPTWRELSDIPTAQSV